MSGSSKNSDPPHGLSDQTGSVSQVESNGDSIDATGDLGPSLDGDSVDTGVYQAILDDPDSTGVESEISESVDPVLQEEGWASDPTGAGTGSLDHSVDDPTGRSPIIQEEEDRASQPIDKAPQTAKHKQVSLVQPTAPLHGATGFEFHADSSAAQSAESEIDKIETEAPLVEAPVIPAVEPNLTPQPVEKPSSSASESGSSMQSDLNTMSGWIRGRLTVVSGVALGRTWYLNRGQLVVGRDLECDVVLDDSSISQRHCRLVRDESGYRVVDMGSLNGTYLNDRLVDGAELTDGDLLRVGESTFKYTRVGAVHVEQNQPTLKEQTVAGIVELSGSNQGLFSMGLAIFASLMLSSAMVRGLQWAPNLDSSVEATRWVKNARSAIEIRDWRRARDELAIAGALDPQTPSLERLRGLVLLELDNALTLRLLERGAREDSGPDKLQRLLEEVEAKSVYRFEAERLVELGSKRYVEFRLNAIGAALDRGDKKSARRESEALTSQATTVADINEKIEKLWKSRRVKRRSKR